MRIKSLAAYIRGLLFVVSLLASAGACRGSEALSVTEVARVESLGLLNSQSKGVFGLQYSDRQHHLLVATYFSAGLLPAGEQSLTRQVALPKTAAAAFEMWPFSTSAPTAGAFIVPGRFNPGDRPATLDVRTGGVSVHSEEGGVSTCALAPNGTNVLYGFRDGRIEMWTPSRGGLVRIGTGVGEVVGVAGARDGRVVSSHDDGGIYVWAPSGEIALAFRRREGVLAPYVALLGGPATEVIFAEPNGAISAIDMNTAVQWRIRQGSDWDYRKSKIRRGVIYSFLLDHDERFLVVGSKAVLEFYNPRSFGMIAQASFESYETLTALAQAGDRLAVGTGISGSVRVYRIALQTGSLPVW